MYTIPFFTDHHSVFVFRKSTEYVASIISLKTKKMNWKRLFKYVAITLVLLTIIGMIWVTREGTSMYGGFTEKVDYEQFNPKEGPVAITNVNVLSTDGEHFIPNQTVFIEEGKITAIETEVEISEDIFTIDGSGKYLIPGLVDTHVHLFKSPNDLLLYIANGITEIRELIGEEDHLIWKKQIEDGRVGPKMFVASPRL